MKEDLLKLVGSLVLIPLLLLYTSLTAGYVTHTFYNWFVINEITGLPNFTILQFIGFSYFLLALLPSKKLDYIKEEYKESKVSQFGGLFLMPWVILLFGYLIHLFY